MVASEVDLEKEDSIASKEEVNASSYVSFHNGQIFEQGLSFSGNERNKVWINTGERFADLSDLSGADTPNDSRAVIAADLDDDGDVDMFVHSIQRERHALFRNDAQRPGKDANYLKLRLRAATSQYEAIGASVFVSIPSGTTAQVLSRGAGFVSCQAPELVFGLGGAREASVEVLWPGGVRESFGTLTANSSVLLTEGTGKGAAIARNERVFADPLPPGLRLDEGDLFPKLAVRGRDGAPAVLDVAALSQGRSVLLNLWADYCVGCIAELPVLQKKHGTDDAVRIVLLSVDAPGETDKARRRLDGLGVTMPSFFRGDDPASAGASSLQDLIDLDRLKLPTTLVLSAEGRVEAILQGPLTE